MLRYEQEPIKVSDHAAEFEGNGHCGSEDMDLVCHMNLQDHMIKESCDFMCTSPSR